jgi:hypothetical protein
VTFASHAPTFAGQTLTIASRSPAIASRTLTFASQEPTFASRCIKTAIFWVILAGMSEYRYRWHDVSTTNMLLEIT